MSKKKVVMVFRCFCGKKFTSKTAYEDHYAKKHSDVIAATSKNGKRDDNPIAPANAGSTGSSSKRGPKFTPKGTGLKKKRKKR